MAGGKTAKKTAKNKDTRFDEIAALAGQYGERSLENYAVVRSLAEALRDGLCKYLGHDKPCVFLVPPQGVFGEQNYGSAAFSVAGKGFLPLEPISFGLAVRVSNTGDFLRIVLNCRKEGNHIDIQIEQKNTYEVVLPIDDEKLQPVIDGLYKYILGWFSDRIEQYDEGQYGTSDIGFDILHIEGGE